MAVMFGSQVLEVSSSLILDLPCTLIVLINDWLFWKIKPDRDGDIGMCQKKKKNQYLQQKQQLEHLIAQFYGTDVARGICNKIGLLQAAFIDDVALWIIYYLMNITDVE